MKRLSFLFRYHLSKKNNFFFKVLDSCFVKFTLIIRYCNNNIAGITGLLVMVIEDKLIIKT